MNNLQNKMPLKETNKTPATYPELIKIYELLDKKLKIIGLNSMVTKEQKQTTEHHQEKYMNKWQSLIKK